MASRHSTRITVVFALATILVMLATALAVALPGDPVVPYTTNADCLYCHESETRMQATGNGTTPAVVFAVSNVDYGACSACHTPGLAGAHPYHNSTSDCGAVCHPGYGVALQTAVPSVVTTAGSFAAASSLSVDSTTLHSIHANPRWAATKDTVNSACSSCHAIAACDACHTGNVQPTHADHGPASSLVTTWTGTTARGIVGEDQTVRSAVLTESRCAGTNCHDLAGQVQSSVALVEENDPTVTSTGTWRVKNLVNHTAGHEVYCNTTGGTRSYTFTGQAIDVIGDLDKTRGKGEVWIDGVLMAAFDQYSATTQYQTLTYSSPKLAYGTHTIMVKVLGQKQAASTGTYVAIDAYKVYPTKPGPYGQSCVATCHSAATFNALHDGSAGFTHDASATVGATYQMSGYAAYGCEQCHSRLLKTEHGRATSTGSQQSCNNCHTTYSPLTWSNTYDYTCNYTRPSLGATDTPQPCHAGTREAHLAATTGHAMNLSADPAEKSCRDCHTRTLATGKKDLAGIHDNPITTNAYATNCLSCHTATKYPTSANCLTAGCHVASGVTSLANHVYPTAGHLSASTDAGVGVGTTGGKACSTCHVFDLKAEHDKSSSRTGANGAIGCATCHDATYFTYGWDKTCSQCHATGKAPVAHTGYNTRHDYSLFSAANTSSCGGATCHDVTKADVIHASALPGTGDCTSCHTTPNGTVTKTLCTDCHAAGIHTQATAHNASTAAFAGNAECTSCHAPYTNLEAHASCAECHSSAKLTQYLGGRYTAACASCHTTGAGKLGKTYSPVATQHYADTTHTAQPFTAAAQGTGADGVVDAGGKECSLCHVALLTTAHTGTSKGTTTCVGCHTNTTLGSAAQVTANWTNDRCTDCHDTGSAKTHDGATTVHQMVAGSCAGTGVDCHAATSLRDLHVSAQGGGAPRYASCANVGCHDVIGERPNSVSASNSCGSTSFACHTDKTPSNHGAASAHGFSAASNLNAAGDTGCTNSGAGCHGTDAALSNYADYHPTTGCATGKCHTSSSKAAYAGSGECVSCHDSNFVNAQDRVALGGTVPNGHYSETTHTATGASATMSAGGLATATCANCHNPNPASGPKGLAGQHTDVPVADGSTYGTTVSCGECHNDTRSRGQVEVLANWTANACADCHSVTSSAPQHSTTAPYVAGSSPAGCGDTGLHCHTTYDLHDLHKDAVGGCGLAGCHDYTKQAAKPTLFSCGTDGACHSAISADLTHYPAAKHEATTLTQANDTSYAGVRCGDCHSIDPADGGLVDQHAMATVQHSTSPNDCQNCHNNPLSTPVMATHWAERDTTVACKACHADGSDMEIHPTIDSSKHAAQNSSGCGSTGAGCHPTSDLSKVGSDKTANLHDACVRCHDRTGSPPNMEYDPLKNSCGEGRACHNTVGAYDPAQPYHIAPENLVDGNDSDHHVATMTASAYAGVYAGGQSCASCHSAGMSDAHTASSVGSVTCASCHNNATLGSPNVVKTSWPTRSCSACHATASVHTTYQTSGGYATAHRGTSANGCATPQAGCHSSNELGALHANAPQGCNTCHAADKVMTSVSKTCGEATGCHTTGTYHTGVSGNDTTHTATAMNSLVDAGSGYLGNACSDCHTATLKTSHAKSGPTSSLGWTDECMDCHTSTSPVNAAAQVSAGWPTQTCLSCHTTNHSGYASGHQGQPTGTSTCSGCHPNDSTDLRIVHKNAVTTGRAADAGCGLVGCHSTPDSTPSAKTCGIGGACHTDKADGNHGLKHDLNVAASNYSATTETGCTNAGAGCHGFDQTARFTPDYHEPAGCQTSGCHTSPSRASHTTPLACQDCHDGTFVNSPLRVNLPVDHYNETTHTASGMGASVSSGGSASATCANCHNPSPASGTKGLVAQHTNVPLVAGSTYGSTVGCGECHNDVRANGQAEVLANWSNSACADCHAVGSSSPQHGSVAPAVNGTSSEGCGASGSNCHTTYDVHALHKNAAAGCAISGCHDYSQQAAKPTALSCGVGGACHTTYAAGTAHYSSAKHAPTNTVQATATFSGTSCETCHIVSLGEGGLNAEHALGTSAKSTSATNICLNCHNHAASSAAIASNWAQKDTASACAECHSGALAVHADPNSTAHTKAASTGCASTGAGCHPTADLSKVGSDKATNIHDNCARCHDRAGSASVPAPGGGNMAWDPAKTTCGAGRTCHNIGGQYPVSGDPLHRNGLASAVTGIDTTHSPTQLKSSYPESAAGVFTDNQECSACHSNALKTAHGTISSNGGTLTCAECHNATGATNVAAATAQSAVKNNWPTDRCTDCHPNANVHTTFKTGTSTYASGHAASMDAGCSGSGAGCHGTRPNSTTSVAPAGELAQLHPGKGCSAAGGTGATSCHGVNKVMSTGVSKTCGGASNCHATYTTSAGHFGGATSGNDATHTADMAVGGYASVYAGSQACTLCHSAGMKTAHTGTSSGMSSGTLSCTDCHNDATLGSASQVKSNWTNNRCTDCHGPASVHTTYQTGAGIASAHKATSAAGCGTSGAGCHTTEDLGALHASKGCAISGCHSVDKNMKSASKTCGESTGCHTTGTFHSGVTGNDATHTATSMTTQVDALSGFKGNTCQDCHSATLVTSHSKTGPTGNLGWTNECTDCHNQTTPINAANVVKTNWSPKVCLTCHTSNHDAYASGHLGVPTGANTCSGCHTNDSLDLRVVHKNAITVGSPLDTGCGIVGCHNVTDSRPVNKSCGTGGACHTDKIDGNHGGATAHTFATASDYNNTTVAGCTNSGAGCHGTETTYSNWADYHPSTGCQGGPCHTSATKASFSATYSGDATCADCHNGNYANAQDVVSITAAAPNGHYDETSHTASGLTGTVSAGGTASAACTVCHSGGATTGMKALYGQHQAISVSGTAKSLTCSDCHNKNAAVSNIVTTKWTAKTCAACHTTSVLPGLEAHGATAPAVNGTAGTYNAMACSSAGCHNTADLHTIHKDAAGGCTLSGCHDSTKQGIKPTGTSCGTTGTCHTAAEPHNATLLSTAHDASAVAIPQPGNSTSYTTATVEAESWATSTWPADQIRSSTTNVTLVNTAGRNNGTYAAQLAATSTTRVTVNFYKDLDLTPYQEATVRFWSVTGALSGSSDYFRVDYSTNGGTTWVQLLNVTGASTARVRTLQLPGGVNARLRFSGSYNATTEYTAIDDILVVGTSSSKTPIASNSSATVSCQNNPNGYECHVVNDVRPLHAALATPCSNCHKAGGPTLSCQTSNCHSTQYENVDSHADTNHWSSQMSTATGQPFAGTGLDVTSCTGCHDDTIMLEHRAIFDYWSTPCSMCHKRTTDSGPPMNVTAANVQAAIAKAPNTTLCTDCHKTVTKSAIHVQRPGNGGTPGTQFADTWSGHKVYDTMPGSPTSFATGTTAGTVTWSLPTATSWLKTGWTTTTMAVRCSDCHGVVTGATGPHGASMRLNMAAGYDNTYATGQLYITTAGAMSNATNICAKCHVTTSMGYNNVHSRSNHRGTAVPCITCHNRVPHAWKRPRLIGYTTDPEPYQSTKVTGITARAYTPTGWQSSYCGVSGCGTHPATPTTPVWP